MGSRPSVVLPMLAIAVFAAVARGERRLDAPDLETAAHAARLVVDGDLVESWTEEAAQDGGKVTVWHVKVRGILAGPTDGAARPKPGELIRVAGIQPRYQLSPDLTPTGRLRPLAAADRLLLCLSSKADRFAGPVMFGQTSAEWVLPENAVWYVANDKAYRFVQHFGPRWWAPNAGSAGSVTITETPATFPKCRVLPLATAREQAATARESVSTELAAIERMVRDDVPKLIARCRELSPGKHVWPPEVPVHESIVRTHLIARINAVADVATIVGYFRDPAAAARDGYEPGSIFAFRADCREELLRLLEAGELPAEARRRAADLLDDAGYAYKRDVNAAAASGTPLPHGGAFARRLAAVAMTTEDEPSADRLLRGVRDCIEYEGQTRSKPLAVDLDAAADVVVAAWPRLSPRCRFDASVTLTAIGAAQAARVTPKVGPFITQLEVRGRVPPDAQTRRLPLTYRWHNFLGRGGSDPTLAVVFRDVASGDETELPIHAKPPQIRAEGSRGQFGYNWQLDVDLPPGVKGGTYDVFLRVHRDGAVIGDGIGCRIDVP